MANQPDGFSYNVAANLLRLRLSRGWSMDHVASQAGISLVLVEQAERGGLALQRDVLTALADVFDVSLDELGTAPSKLVQGCSAILDRDPGAPDYLDAVSHARQHADRLGFAAVAARAANVEADLLYRQAQNEAAIRLALATLTRFRVHSQHDRLGLLWTLGRGWLVTDRTDVAGLVFAALVQELPPTHADRVKALMNLGTCYRAGGWYREAVDVYRQVLDCTSAEPDVRAWAQVGLAGSLVYLNAEREAEALLAAVEREIPSATSGQLADSIRLTRLLLEARQLPPDQYRKTFGQQMAQTDDMLLRAHLCETWADLEVHHGNWEAAVEAAETGLTAVSRVGSIPFKLTKARLLWWRGLARENLHLPGAEVDREWARDLLTAEGAPPDYVERYLAVSEGVPL